MYIQLTKFIYLPLLFTFIFNIPTVFAQNREVDPILEVEKDNCEKTIEVNYRSQKLTSPDGKITVYFEGILRRIGNKGDSHNHSYCYPPDRRQTPVLTMIVEQDGVIKKIPQSPAGIGYVVTSPVSFSPDGRYLIISHEESYNGGDAGITYPILDIAKNYKALSHNECEQSSYGGEYYGFVSDSEILFQCGNGVKEYEILNLQNQSIRNVSESFAESANLTKRYGTISEEMTILKRQIFPTK